MTFQHFASFHELFITSEVTFDCESVLTLWTSYKAKKSKNISTVWAEFGGMVDIEGNVCI